MHELSIAMSLIDVITETLIREDATGASRVTVEVGALSGVVPEALRTAFAGAVRNTDLAGCELAIIPVGVTIWCDPCATERPATAVNDLRCGVCSWPATRLMRGRELDVVEIALVTPEHSR